MLWMPDKSIRAWHEGGIPAEQHKRLLLFPIYCLVDLAKREVMEWMRFPGEFYPVPEHYVFGTGFRPVGSMTILEKIGNMREPKMLFPQPACSECSST